MRTCWIGIIGSVLAPSGAAHALTLAPPQHLEPGQSVIFLVSGAAPGATVGLVYGGPPPGACPPVLGGLCLGVSNPVVVASGPANALGRANLQVTVPANAALVDVRFQGAQAGAAPAVTLVSLVPILTTSVGLNVTDAATYQQAQRFWRVTGDLTLFAGNYPIAVSFPHLEEVRNLALVSSRQVDAPALVALDTLGVGPTSGAVVLLPSLASPWTVGGSFGFSAANNTGAVDVDLGSFAGPVSSVSVLYNDAPVALTAPQVQDVTNFSVAFNGPGVNDFTGVLPSLLQADTVGLDWNEAATLAALPGLTSARILTIGSNTGLVAPGPIGAPGCTVTESFYVGYNPLLTDVTAFLSFARGGPRSAYANSSLASCDAEAFVQAGGGDPTCGLPPDYLSCINDPYCGGNALDTCSDDNDELCYD